MSQAEALAFKNASSLVLEETDGSQFLFCDSDLSDYTINQRHGLGMEGILLLEEAGLISALRESNEIEVGESADGFFNGGAFALIFEPDGMQASNIKATRYLRSHDSYCPLCRKKPMMDILRT